MGYWSNHEYKRRSVTKDSELGFLGWNWIEKQLDKFTTIKRLRNRALFLTIFKSGGRINEALSLKRSNFTHDENYIIIIDMKKEKDSDNETYQPIKIPKQEPLNKEWLEWINRFKYGNQYIFPSPQNRGKPIKYVTAYKIISKTGTYPHFLRSQRSSMEIEYYRIPANELQGLRQWKTPRMIIIYAAASSRRQSQEKMLEKFKQP